MGTKVDLSPPWVEYFNKLETFFEKDNDITVQLFEEEEEKIIKLFIEEEKKAEALEKLLPKEKVFGNVKVKVSVIPANEEESCATLFREALDGNEAVSFIETVPSPFGSAFTFVVFEKEVAQYWNDNMADYNGMTSTLYQELAKEIFSDTKFDGLYFCTDVE